jgi:GMP synthase (glutamine-hydrolysing)
MKLGILRTDTVRPEWSGRFGEYPDMFIRLLGGLDPDIDFRVYHVEAGEYPADIDEVDAYLITGSKFGVYDDEPWIHRLADFVRALHARGKKVVGVCFGHQMVAHALGGRAGKSDRGWGVGLHRHSFHTRPDWFDDGDPEFRVLVSHQDQVEALPPGMQVLAGSDFCPMAVCQLGDSILTFQGHPEFEPDYAREIMQLRREMIGEDTYRRGMDSLSEAPEAERMGRWILAFLKAPAV